MSCNRVEEVLRIVRSTIRPTEEAVDGGPSTEHSEHRTIAIDVATADRARELRTPLSTALAVEGFRELVFDPSTSIPDAGENRARFQIHVLVGKTRAL
jgi:hypothetical protein